MLARHDKIWTSKKERTMKMQQVREKAKEFGLKPGKIKRKADLIRAIQIEEGNTSCFQAEVSDCKETDCCWRNDCQGWVG